MYPGTAPKTTQTCGGTGTDDLVTRTGFSRDLTQNAKRDDECGTVVCHQLLIGHELSGSKETCGVIVDAVSDSRRLAQPPRIHDLRYDRSMGFFEMASLLTK